MLTIADIRNRAKEFPEDKPVEELPDQLITLYKIDKGLKDVEEGKVISMEDFEKQMKIWWKLKQSTF